MSIKIIESDENLKKYSKSWASVPLFLNDGLLMPLPSEWTLDMTIQGLSPQTVISYAKSIAIWFEALEINNIQWDDVSIETAQMFIQVLYKQGVSDGTIRLRVIHIQEFYKWALNKEYIQRLPFEIKKRNINTFIQSAPTISIPKKPNRKVKAQSDNDFDTIVAANPRKSSSLSKRDEIIAEIARYMGLRRSEIASLTKEQFLNLDINNEILLIDIVTAKSRGRVDSVLVPKLLLKKTLQYIEVERASIVETLKRNNPEYKEVSALFLNERGKNRGEALDADYIGDTWKRAANIAGIDSRFHDNRSSFATNAAKLAREHGENSKSLVKDLLRHKTEDSAHHYVEFEKMESDRLMRARLINDAYNKEQNEE